MFTGLFELAQQDTAPPRIAGLYDQDADADPEVDLREEAPPIPKRPPRPKVSVPTPFDEDAGPTEQLAIDLGPG